ncbi:chaperonin [Campylobacter hyointestinalis]|uniref:DMT family transporter n=1 Tax=Campylobacter hyointestinalis TaxID=198 RepID=UPI0004D369C9|nr:SMR family transporter [Campylobacter hyointestinalis]ANE32957.1 multidrug efflux system protein, EmrE family [Campylobacter hyointestinalis subsp. hyointestinalis LMG 9260]KEA43960.1 chaperonin [Campylobacter hyointestinalis subsp. hyointestinalis]QKF56127.1 multidrug efflux system protein, EmrE family [Campylobacter hyointestinalis subsp. hyointestinalis]TXK47034.1 chaperonin [Campylobacter hyointestinalis]SFT63427.1 paired small multidrug resistance pump [Campylobacter hyointestinalis]
MNKGLFFVLLGAIFECGWAYGLKHADSNLEYLITICFICVSFFSFMSAFKYLLASVAYTLFIGFGTLFIVSAEILTDYFNRNSVDYLRLFFIATLLVGVLGIKGVKN